MRKWTIETARKTLKRPKADVDEPFARATGFLEGHASRDPEVAKITADKDFAYRQMETALDDRDKYLETLLAEREASRKLMAYTDHGGLCILTRWEGGAPTGDGGYRSKYAGRWYQEKPIDETPKCTCGLTDLLKFYATPGHSPEGKGN